MAKTTARQVRVNKRIEALRRQADLAKTVYDYPTAVEHLTTALEHLQFRIAHMDVHFEDVFGAR